MSDPHLPPLDPELAALLDAERGATPDAGALDRVWSRVAVGMVPSGHGGGAGAGGAGGVGAGAGAGSGWLASHALGVAVATFVAGGVAGAGLHAVLQAPPPARVVHVERPAAPVAPVAPLAPAPVASVLPAADPTSVPAAPVAHASAHAASSASGSSLAAERSLLDDARGALGSGDAAKAFALLEDHARRYPRGQLGEEREALAIQALVALGRGPEARARAARFRAVSPNSLFAPAIEGALQANP